MNYYCKFLKLTVLYFCYKSGLFLLKMNTLNRVDEKTKQVEDGKTQLPGEQTPSNQHVNMSKASDEKRNQADSTSNARPKQTLGERVKDYFTPNVVKKSESLLDQANEILLNIQSEGKGLYERLKEIFTNVTGRVATTVQDFGYELKIGAITIVENVIFLFFAYQLWKEQTSWKCKGFIVAMITMHFGLTSQFVAIVFSLLKNIRDKNEDMEILVKVKDRFNQALKDENLELAMALKTQKRLRQVLEDYDQGDIGSLLYEINIKIVQLANFKYTEEEQAFLDLYREYHNHLKGSEDSKACLSKLVDMDILNRYIIQFRNILKQLENCEITEVKFVRSGKDDYTEDDGRTILGVFIDIVKGFFDKKENFEIKQHSNDISYINTILRFIKNTSNVLTLIIKLIKQAFFFCYEKATGIPYLEQDQTLVFNDMLVWLEESVNYFEQDKNVYMNDPTHRLRWRAFYDKGLHIQRELVKYKIPAHHYSVLSAALRSLQHWEDEFKVYESQNHSGIEPVLVEFSGSSAVGKSTLLDKLQASLTAIWFNRPTESSDRYCPSTTSEYFEGYHRQPFFVWDDYWQNTDQQYRQKVLLFLMAAANCNPFNMDQAALENKGCVFFDSRVLWLTSNTVTEQTDEGLIQSMVAFFRRQIHIRVSWRDGYNWNDDLSHQRYDIVDPNKIDDVLVPDISYDQLVQLHVDGHNTALKNKNRIHLYNDMAKTTPIKTEKKDMDNIWNSIMSRRTAHLKANREAPPAVRRDGDYCLTCEEYWNDCLIQPCDFPYSSQIANVDKLQNNPRFKEHEAFMKNFKSHQAIDRMLDEDDKEVEKAEKKKRGFVRSMDNDNITNESLSSMLRRDVKKEIIKQINPMTTVYNVREAFAQMREKNARAKDKIDMFIYDEDMGKEIMTSVKSTLRDGNVCDFTLLYSKFSHWCNQRSEFNEKWRKARDIMTIDYKCLRGMDFNTKFFIKTDNNGYFLFLSDKTCATIEFNNAIVFADSLLHYINEVCTYSATASELWFNQKIEGEMNLGKLIGLFNNVNPYIAFSFYAYLTRAYGIKMDQKNNRSKIFSLCKALGMEGMFSQIPVAEFLLLFMYNAYCKRPNDIAFLAPIVRIDGPRYVLDMKAFTYDGEYGNCAIVENVVKQMYDTRCERNVVLIKEFSQRGKTTKEICSYLRNYASFTKVVVKEIRSSIYFQGACALMAMLSLGKLAYNIYTAWKTYKEEQHPSDAEFERSVSSEAWLEKQRQIQQSKNRWIREKIAARTKPKSGKGGKHANTKGRQHKGEVFVKSVYDPQAELWAELVKKNYVRISVNGFRMYGVGICNRSIICAAHFMEPFTQEKLMTLHLSEEKKYTYTLDEVTVSQFNQVDWCILSFNDTSIPEFHNITSYFIENDEKLDIVASSHGALIYPEGIKMHAPVEMLDGEVEYDGLVSERIYIAEAPSIQGDCSILNIAYNTALTKGKLFGIIVASCVSADLTMCCIITQEDIKELIPHAFKRSIYQPNFEPSIDFTRIMCENVKIDRIIDRKFGTRTMSKTNLVQTKLHETSCTKTPAQLQLQKNENGRVVSPFEEGLAKKLFRSKNNYDHPMMEKVVKHFGQSIPHLVEARVLTDEEALNGVRGTEFGKVELSTSMGYMGDGRFSVDGQPGKKGYLKYDFTTDTISYQKTLHGRRLEREIVCVGEYLLTNDENSLCYELDGIHYKAPLLIVQDCLKDEKLPHHKVFKDGEWQGKTRIMGPVPFHYLFWSRKLFGAFVLNVLKWRKHNGPFDFGIDIKGLDFNFLLKNMLHGISLEDLRALCGDLGNCDASILEVLAKHVWTILKMWYDLGKGWTQDDEQRAWNLFYKTFIEVVHIVGNVVYITTGNPSGNLLTGIFNSIVIIIVFGLTALTTYGGSMERADWVMKNIHTFGDDHILIFPSHECCELQKKKGLKPRFDGPWFSMHDVAAMFAKYGMVYTGTDKTGELPMFYKHHEMTYLKRKIVVLDCGVYAAALDWQTIMEIPMFMQKDQAPLKALKAAIDSAMEELVLYGPDNFYCVLRYWNDKLLKHYNTSFHYDYTALFCRIYKWQKFDTEIEYSKIISNKLPVGKEASKFYTKRSYFQMIKDNFKRSMETNVEAKPDATKEEVAQGEEQEDDNLVITEGNNTRKEDNTGSTVPELGIGGLASPVLAYDNPYPMEGLDMVLGRTYEINQWVWQGSQAFGVPVGALAFPDAIFNAAPQLTSKLSYYNFFRATVEIEFRINTTEFFSGDLLLCWLPYYNTFATQDFFAPFTDIWTSTCLHTVRVCANSSAVVKVIIPQVRPVPWYDMTLNPVTQSGMFGYLRAFVLHPARSGQCGSNVNIPIAISARFTVPEVAGLLGEQEAIKTRKRIKMFKHKFDNFNRSMEKEQNTRSATGLMSSVAECTSDIAYLLKPFPMVSDMANGVDAITQTISSLAENFAHDMPTNVKQVEPVAIKHSSGFHFMTGTDDAIKLAADPSNRVSDSKDIFCENTSYDYFNEYKRIPALVATGSVDSSSAKMTKLMTIPVAPMFCHSSTVGALTKYNLTPLGMYASMFRYWRGKINYMLVISCNEFVSFKLWLQYVSKASYDTSGQLIQDVGNTYNIVRDIKGSATITFSVPILHNQDWIKNYAPDVFDFEQPNDSFTNDQTMNGKIILNVFSPVTSCNVVNGSTVYFSLFIAGGSSFECAVPVALFPGYLVDPDQIGKMKQKIIDKYIKEKEKLTKQKLFKRSMEGTSQPTKADTAVTPSDTKKKKLIPITDPALLAGNRAMQRRLKLLQAVAPVSTRSGGKVDMSKTTIQNDLRLAFLQDFPPFAKANEKYSEKIFFGEHIGSFHSYLHRYSFYDYQELSAEDGYPYVLSPYLNTSDGIWFRVHKMFMFYRGSYRFKYICEFNSSSDLPYFYLTWMNESPPSDPFTNGTIVQDILDKRVVEIEVPYYLPQYMYSTSTFGSIPNLVQGPAVALSYPSWTAQTAPTTKWTVVVATGDDYSFGWPVNPCPIYVVQEEKVIREYELSLANLESESNISLDVATDDTGNFKKSLETGEVSAKINEDEVPLNKSDTTRKGKESGLINRIRSKTIRVTDLSDVSTKVLYKS